MSARFISSALIFITLLIPTDAFAAVVLSEIQVAGSKASDEFIELYNSSDESVNLSGWSLRRKSANDTTNRGSSLKTLGSSDTLPAHGYFLWANSVSIFKDHADTTTGSSLSDNNSLALYDKDGVLIDSLTWGTGHALPYSPRQLANPDEKEIFVRDLDTLTWSAIKSSTPTNSKGEVFKNETGTAGEEDSPHEILINEVLPNPKEKGDTGEFIELYNPGSEPVDLSGWEIRDASITGRYVFPSGASIPTLGYLVVTDKEFSLSLNNSHETLSLRDKEKRFVHRVQYEKTKEGVALNLVGSTLRGARRPTPGAINVENTNPVTQERVPKKGHRGFAIEFRARGKDSDGDKLKFTWDFGDGHKSYRENTSHKYLKSGRYAITLTTDDGIDVTDEIFEITIEKYRTPKVRIVSFVPNPKGNDSDLEWIEIENRERKAVNLKTFSIATGTKKKSIVNHPIRKDFIIPAKSVKRLTREHSLFTLGNIRGRIELRAPDGKVIQDLKYAFDKSLADNTLLKKEKGQALIAIAAPPKSDPPEVEVGTSDTLPITPAEILSTTEVPEKEEIVSPIEIEAEPELKVYPHETVNAEKLTWTRVISSGTPFTLPSSFVLKVNTTIPSNEVIEDKNGPLMWQDAVNEFLNRLLVRLI